MATGAVAEPWTGADVGKRKPNEPPPKFKVFALRLSPADAERVAKVAAGLRLDEAQFLRMLTVENLGKYERRVEQIESGASSE